MFKKKILKIENFLKNSIFNEFISWIFDGISSFSGVKRRQLGKLVNFNLKRRQHELTEVRFHENDGQSVTAVLDYPMILRFNWWNNGRRVQLRKWSEGQRFDNDCDYHVFFCRFFFIDHFLIGGVRRHDTWWAFCPSKNGLKVADIFIDFPSSANEFDLILIQ